VPPPGSFLREAKGTENRIEIELRGGQVIRLSGQGAGRWPTAVSVVGDLHEVARLAESARLLPNSQGTVLRREREITISCENCEIVPKA
jgi:hypothetical protein